VPQAVKGDMDGHVGGRQGSGPHHAAEPVRLMCPSVATAGGPRLPGPEKATTLTQRIGAADPVIPRSRCRLLSKPISDSEERFDEATPQLSGGGEDLLVGLDLLVHGLVELHDRGLLGWWR
jgi:hypothetical protein